MSEEVEKLVPLTSEMARAQSDMWQEAMNRALAAEAENAALWKALEPFARIAEHLARSDYGPAWGFNGGVLEHEDFRRAAETFAALSAPAEEREQVQELHELDSSNHPKILDSSTPESSASLKMKG